MKLYSKHLSLSLSFSLLSPSSGKLSTHSPGGLSTRGTGAKRKTRRARGAFKTEQRRATYIPISLRTKLLRLARSRVLYIVMQSAARNAGTTSIVCCALYIRNLPREIDLVARTCDAWYTSRASAAISFTSSFVENPKEVPIIHVPLP